MAGDWGRGEQVQTTTYGYKNPSIGDFSKGATQGWMASMNFNITRLDGHSHNGIDSVQLSLVNFSNAAVVQNIVASSYSVLPDDVLICVNYSGTCTLTLPDATATEYVGQVHEIVNVGSGTVQIGTLFAQTISGQSSYSLSTQYRFVKVRSDGSNWQIVGAG